MKFCFTKQCFISAFSCLFCVNFPNNAKAMFAFTAFNKSLVGFAYKTTENVDWLHCIQACKQEVSCISYNFWRGICELNDCGFEDGCTAESTLIWLSGSTFQQLAPIQDVKSRCDNKRVNFETNETAMINASFSCQQRMSVYADGNSVTFMNSTKPIKDIDCYQLQPLAINFAIHKTTQVVAIAAEGNRGVLITGSFTDGVVTDAKWKCTSNDEPAGWALPGFDDSRWNQAEEFSRIGGGGGTDDTIKGILPNAKWITTKNATQHKFMYCRLPRGIK